VVFVAAGVAGTLALWYFTIRLPPIPQRPLRIGFEHNPPVQIRTDSGFTGLAVETVNEAAKRAGVRLQWVETGTSSDAAFQKGLVDLWPLMADLPDRRKRVYITRPWLHSSHALLLRAGLAYPDPGFTGRIALFKMPVHVRLLREHFPDARLVEFPDVKEVVSEVCRGAVDAGFLEGRVALTALREKPPECASAALRVQILRDLTLQHGLASTFEAAGAAEAIRGEIGNMFRDGTLALTIAKYSYYGLDDTWATYDLMEASERARWMAWGIGALVIVLTATFWRAGSLRQRKRAEAALRESEQRFRATFFQAAVGIAQTSPDSKWLLLNDRFCEMLGYTQAELRGKTFLDFTHPDDREASLTAVRRALAGEISSWSTEKRYVRKDGTIVWARLWASLVRDQDNRPQYFISVVEDITDRMEAERALRDSEQRLALARSAAHLGLWDWDLRTNAHTVFGEYLQLFGLSADYPDDWLSVIHPDDRKRVQAALQDSIEQTHAWDTEFRVVWPDGGIHWLLGKGTVFLDDSGQPVRIAGVNLDITVRKQAEELRSHLAAIVESSDDAIIGKTLDGVVVSWNPGAERIYGYKAEEMVGQPVSLLVPPDRLDEIPQILERLRHGERFEQYETTRVRKDGRRIEISVTISPIRDSSGAVVGASAIARDITEQKQAEARLRESEERFRNMADTAPVMIWISGADKLHTFFNKTWLDFTGRTMEQELGSGWATGVHPDDLDRSFATYSSSFDARCSFRMEYRLRRADGEYRCVLDDGVPLYRGDEFGGYIGSCIDVTEQKLAQDRLRTSERRLIGAQRLAQVGSWERHFEGEAIYWSDEMFRICGLPAGPALHFQTFLSYVHPDDREKIRDANHEALTTMAPVIVEYRITRPDGDLRFVRSVVEVIVDNPGAHPRMAGATRDITDRKRAEEERARLSTLVQKEHERLNAIISSIPGAVWETRGSSDNPAKQVTFMSNQVEEMLGYTADQWMTAPGFWPSIVHQDDRSRFVREAIEIFTSEKGSGSHQYRCLTKDGRTVWLESRASAIREKTGTSIGLRGVTIDISERKEAQAALLRAQEELARVTRGISMGEVAASIAHEINQPLAAVVTNGEACLRFLAATAPNIEKAKAILTNIISDGNHASEVIRRIRALFAKVGAHKDSFDLNQLIRDTILLLEGYAQSHNVLVRTHLEESLLPVFGDRTQLRQLLLNLVMNGIEATGKGPYEARLVVIMTRNDAPPGIRLEVSDSGIGIQSGDRERIFHPFFTTKEAGLGMGLSISRTIVESHGGRILVQPNHPHGTRFLVLLPNERMT
jgi:PAS domain S-box-containing protein